MGTLFPPVPISCSSTSPKYFSSSPPKSFSYDCCLNICVSSHNRSPVTIEDFAHDAQHHPGTVGVAQKYFCSTCNVACSNTWELNRHYGSERHLKKKGPPSIRAQAHLKYCSTRFLERSRASIIYYCSLRFLGSIIIFEHRLTSSLEPLRLWLV